MSLEDFTFSEVYALDGHRYSWRLKEGELRFRGAGMFAGLVAQRIPAPIDRIERFRSALDLLDVWSWRSDYHPRDYGYEVDDGSYWTFQATASDRQCQCGGGNAYPSYASAAQTSREPERFGLLMAALYQIFSIDWYIQQAKQCKPSSSS